MGESTEKKGYSFGTFKGVYTPSVLTIFGVVMYLRFGWVLGNVGLPSTLLIVTLATSITFFTGLSISAMATNMKVGTGGAVGTGIWQDFSPLDSVHQLTDKKEPAATADYAEAYARFEKANRLCGELVK